MLVSIRTMFISIIMFVRKRSVSSRGRPRMSVSKSISICMSMRMRTCLSFSVRILCVVRTIRIVAVPAVFV